MDMFYNYNYKQHLFALSNLFFAKTSIKNKIVKVSRSTVLA